MEEVWKDIDGYNGCYQVSNKGNVRSLYSGGKAVAQLMAPRGYLTVHLSMGGKAKRALVHRLVALAFIPNFDKSKNQVNHKNEIKTDNRAENLEWCDQQYNNCYGTRIERASQTNIKNGKKSKPLYQINFCGNIVKKWNSAKEVQRSTSYSQAAISRCCNGKQKSAYGYIWRYAK